MKKTSEVKQNPQVDTVEVVGFLNFIREQQEATPERAVEAAEQQGCRGGKQGGLNSPP